MAGETPLTLVGNLTADPELRFTPAGHAVANFTIASTPKVFNRQTNSFDDGETLFMRCNVWREQAENLANSLVKGTQVIAQGYLKPRSYDTKEGEKRTVMELECQHVGPTLMWQPVQLGPKPQRNAAPPQQGLRQEGYNTGGAQNGWGQRGQQQDPNAGWGAPPSQRQPASTPWNNSGDQEPPF